MEIGDPVTDGAAREAFGKSAVFADLSSGHELPYPNTVRYCGEPLPGSLRRPHVFVRRRAGERWTYLGRGSIARRGLRRGVYQAEITVEISSALFLELRGGAVEVEVYADLEHGRWNRVERANVADAAEAIERARVALATHDPVYVHLMTLERQHAELFQAGGKVGAVDYLSYATNARDPTGKTWVAHGHRGETTRSFDRTWDLAYALDAETALACARAKLEGTPLPEGYRWQDPQKKFPGQLARRPKPKPAKRQKVRLTKKELPELFDLTAWRACDKGRRDEIGARVLDELGPGWRRRRPARFGAHGTTILPFETGKVVFHLIPGGTYMKGMSAAERETLRELDERGEAADYGLDVDSLPAPVRARVRPFLCARRPLSYPEARGLVMDDEWNRGDLWDDEGNSTGIAYVTREEARTVSRTWGMRLWTDDEAEWATRGGGQSLFFWGDTCTPADLERAMFFRFSDRRRAREASNDFGLLGLTAGAFTEDDTVRGGAANLWPFQGAGERLFLPSALTFPVESAAFGLPIRLAFSL